MFDLNNPQHLPLNQQSPSESISHSYEVCPPNLSNSPESGASVRSNSPSATGSPRMSEACVAPGLQTSRGAGPFPTFIHHDSYGSDQSQSYESMYDPIATSTEKAGAFVGELNRFPSPLPPSFLTHQDCTTSLLLSRQFSSQDGHQKEGSFVNDYVESVSEEAQRQQERSNGRDDPPFSKYISEHSSSERVEPSQPFEASPFMSAERCTFFNLNFSELSSLRYLDQTKKPFSFSPSLQNISESSDCLDLHTKDCLDVDGLQSSSCSSPSDRIDVDEGCCHVFDT